MTTLLSKQQYSRQKARKIMIEFLGRNLCPNHHIHHIDEDPFNNNISNLCVLKASTHHRLHLTGKKYPTRDKILKSTLSDLELALMIFNNF